MANSKPILTISTPKLTMRPFAPTDANSLQRIMNEPGIMQYFPHTAPPDMERMQGLIEHQLTQWKEYNLGWWIIVPQERIEFIGWNGLQYFPETDEVEVGYLLSRQFWGQGLATEGAKASLEFGFKKLGLGQIIGLTYPENTSSQIVLKKCGMRYTEQKEYFGM